MANPNVLRNVRVNTFSSNETPIADPSVLLIKYPTVFDQMIEQFMGEVKNYLPMVQARLGLFKVLKSKLGTWYEKGTVQEPIIPASGTASVTAPSGGAGTGAVTFTIASTQYQDSGTASPGAQNQTLQIPGTYTTVAISNKNTSTPYAHTVTVVAPNGYSGTALLTLIQGVYNFPLIPVAPISSEGGGFVTNGYPMPQAYISKTGIISMKLAVTGTLSGVETPAKPIINPANGQPYVTTNGEPIYGNYAWCQHAIKMAIAIENAYELGQGESYPDLLNSSATASLPTGRLAYARNNGVNFSHPSEMTVDWLYNLSLVAQIQNVSDKYLVDAGPLAMQGIERMLNQHFIHSAIAADSGLIRRVDGVKNEVTGLVESRSVKFVDMGYGGTRVNGTDMYFKKKSTWMDPNSTGLPLSQYPSLILAQPIADGVDENDTPVPYERLCTVYDAHYGDRRMLVAPVGAFVPGGIRTLVDEKSIIGLHEGMLSVANVHGHIFSPVANY